MQTHSPSSKLQAPSFELTNKTRGKTPHLPFREIKDAVLGARYELSLALVTPKEARRITRKTKHKDKPSNVLAFALGKRSGEILLCPHTARLQAPLYGYDQRPFILRLFIHATLHLAGYAHGSTMDRKEDQIAKRFGF